jgi:general secretion pathway protein I
MSRSPKRRGFTLIEVLVALAIAAIGLAAVLSVVTNSTRNAIYLRNKVLASWIAENRITELRLAVTLPPLDKTGGDLEYAGSKWKWEVPGLRRIDVGVRFADGADDATIATMTGFAGRTQLATPRSGTPWDTTGGGSATPGGGGTPAVGTPAPTGTGGLGGTLDGGTTTQ